MQLKFPLKEAEGADYPIHTKSALQVMPYACGSDIIIAQPVLILLHVVQVKMEEVLAMMPKL